MKTSRLFFCFIALLCVALISCHKDPHDAECKRDCPVFPLLFDQNGNFIETLEPYNHKLIDMVTGEKLWPHTHRIDGQPCSNITIGDTVVKSVSFYTSPGGDGTGYTKIRHIMNYQFRFTRDNKEFWIELDDTLDVDLHYFGPNECYIKSFSRGGVELWNRDSCTTNYERSIRVCPVFVNLDSIDNYHWLD